MQKKKEHNTTQSVQSDSYSVDIKNETGVVIVIDYCRPGGHVWRQLVRDNEYVETGRCRNGWGGKRRRRHFTGHLGAEFRCDDSIQTTPSSK